MLFSFGNRRQFSVDCSCSMLCNDARKWIWHHKVQKNKIYLCLCHSSWIVLQLTCYTSLPGSFLCNTIENWSMNRGIGTRIEGKTQFSFWFANSMWTTKKKHCSQLVSTFSHVICKILRALVFKWFIANQFNYEYFDWFEWTHSLDAWNCLYAIRSEIAFAMHAQMCMQTRRFYTIRCFTSRFHSISTNTRLVGDKKSRHMAPDMQWHCNKWRNRYKSS